MKPGRYEGMTDKMIKFCYACVDMSELDASRAAVVAGYSQKTAPQQGKNLLDDPRIKALIKTLRDDKQRSNAVTSDRIVAELAKIAFSSAYDLVDMDTSKLKKLADVEGDVRAAMKSIEFDVLTDENGAFEGERLKVQLYDKIKCLELLGKRFNLFNDKYQLSLGAGVTFNMNYGPGEVEKDITPANPVIEHDN